MEPDTDDALVWAALDFTGGQRTDECVGVDPFAISELGDFAEWSCYDNIGWPTSEAGFRNGGNECYMIAVIQMLGTARPVRQAIQELPLQRDPLKDELTRVLQQDFLPADSRLCASGAYCHLFSQDTSGAAPLVHGVQNDADESLRYVLDAWARLEGAPVAQGRHGFAPLTVSTAHQLFAVLTEWRRGCTRCLTVLSKFEESLTIPILPPPGGQNQETQVKWQLENLGSPEEVAELRCNTCGSVGSCVRRQYLARVGPLLLVQLSIYDVSSRQKLRNVRIHANERLELRADGRDYEYNLVAAIEHVGASLHSGHYICYRRDLVTNTWLVLNDDGATPIGLPHGTRLSATQFLARQMYICLYARSAIG